MKTRLLIAIFLCFSGLGYTQVLIQGTVVSADDNQALPGATILLNASKKLTRSDKSGHFSITTAAMDTVLSVTFTGYASLDILIRDRGSSPLHVVLHPVNNQLKEVTVSSGYQQLPRERATGSFSFIDSKTLNEQVSTDILSRLEAVSNSLYINRSTVGDENALVVRGLSTIRGDKNALVVLDNFPYEGDIQNINPNDIDNITILKDAAAASIWGAKAANGVIVITTRKARLNTPLKLSFNATSTIAGKPDLGYLKQIDPADFIGVEEYLFGQGFYDAEINSSGMPPLSPAVELMLAKSKGLLPEEQYRQAILKLGETDVRDQYKKYFYDQSLNQQYALSLQGGSGSHSWLASSGYDHNKDQSDVSYQRFNLRFHNSLQPLKSLRLTADIYYTQSSSSSGKPAYGSIAFLSKNLYPYARFADESGNPLSIVQHRQGYIDTAGNGKLLPWDYQPLEDYQHNKVSASLSDVLINTGLNLTLFKGLSADLKYQYERQQQKGQTLHDEESFYARDLVNRFSQLNSQTGLIEYTVPKGGVLDLSDNLLNVHNFRGTLNYNRAWNEHQLNLLAGGEARDARSSGNSYTLYGYMDETSVFTDLNLFGEYPEYINGRMSTIPNDYGLSQKTTRFISVFGNGAYTFKGRYTFSGSARRDASNLFGLNINDKWKLLWSSGLSWDISKERFYKLGALPYLRFRATYGFSGNIDPAMSAVTTISYRGSSPYISGVPFASFNTYANPELSWETTRMFNAGLDFETAGRRLSGSLEYYKKKSYNLFGYQAADITAGVGTQVLKNAASIESHGLDLELQSINLKTAKFRWSSQINFSYNTDKVLDYFLESRETWVFTNTGAITAEKGAPVYGLYSYRWAGLDPETGAPRAFLKGEPSVDYLALTGSEATIDDLEYGGRLLPPFFGSLGNTFYYRNLSLSARISYKFGHYFRRSSIDYGSLYSFNQGHSDFALRWQHPGDENKTSVPSMVYPIDNDRDRLYAHSSVLTASADHIRLQYINLSYQLPRNLLTKLHFSSLSVFLNADNLGLIWRKNKFGIDPDYAADAQTPPVKRLSFGIKAGLN